MKCRKDMLLTLTILSMISFYPTVAILLSSVTQTKSSPQTGTIPCVLNDKNNMFASERQTDISPIKIEGRILNEPKLNTLGGTELYSYETVLRDLLVADKPLLDPCRLRWMLYDTNAKRWLNHLIFGAARHPSVEKQRKSFTIDSDRLSERKRSSHRLSINTALHSLADMLKSKFPKSRLGNNALIRKIIDKGK